MGEKKLPTQGQEELIEHFVRLEPSSVSLSLCTT